jgi:hypothetical protein
MTTSPNDPIRELKAVLAEHLPWHGARIGFLAQFLLALLKVRSVSLAELATGFGGKAKADSHYKRLQRFFRSFEIGHDDLARLLVRIGPAGDGPWRLAMDRTHWQFGKADITTSCSASPATASPCRCSGASWTRRATPTPPSESP